MTVEALPEIRQNLQLLPGGSDEDGAPRWLLFDALRNRYFTLTETAVTLLKHWRPGLSPEQLQTQLQKQRITLEQDEIIAFADFLVANHLVHIRGDQAVAQLYQQYRSGLQSAWLWLLHHYLFIRIPLVRPDRFLERWSQRLDWLFSPVTSRLIIGLGLLGVLMVLRQWDIFWSTFLHFFNTQGLLFYGLTLLLVKSAHELGHGFLAKRLGCKVSSIGIAFLVMFPVLYTDTTDAWKLTSRKARLRIVTAGIKTELYLALMATFLWNILPDGLLRSAAFFVATTSWVTSVLVNISPFLRFDGYYAFSDWLGVENLQNRSFALGRWRLRKWLWGLDDPPPEPMPRQRANILVAYAWCTWIYRFFLFLGIAFLVYEFFFKALGIVLFTVEIIWFIGLPIVQELKVWHQRKRDFHLNGTRHVVWILVLLLLIRGWLPLRVSLEVPAVLMVKQEQTLYAPDAGIIVKHPVAGGSRVAQGEILLELSSPELDYQLRKIQIQRQQAETRLKRVAGSLREREKQVITQQQLARLKEQEQGLQQQQAAMIIRAPFAGQVRYATPLPEGSWVNPEMPLFSLVDDSAFMAEGLVSEQDLTLIAPGQTGVFIADQGDISSLPVVVQGINMGAVYALPWPELGSDFAGVIATRKNDNDQLIPEEGLYRVIMSLATPPPEGLNRRVTGIVRIDGQARSPIWHSIKQGIAILRRESGF